MFGIGTAFSGAENLSGEKCAKCLGYGRLMQIITTKTLRRHERSETHSEIRCDGCGGTGKSVFARGSLSYNGQS